MLLMMALEKDRGPFGAWESHFAFELGCTTGNAM